MSEAAIRCETIDDPSDIVSRFPDTLPSTCVLAAALLLLCALPAAAQHPWPVAPRHASHEITGTFSEYRGPASPHFHNGVDVPKADGSPVYAVASGTVTGIDPNGSNAYVRVGRYAYVHIVPNPALTVGDEVEEGAPVGTILSGQGHVHFTDGAFNEEREPLAEGRMTPYEDPWAPVVEGASVQFYVQPTRQRLATSQLTGLVEVSVRIRELNGPPGTSSSRRNNGAHTVGYKVLTRDRQTEVFVPGDDGTAFHFDRKPSNVYVHHVFDASRGASTSDQIYLPTNELTRRTGWDTAGLDGDYTIMLFATDVRGNADTAYIDVSVSPRDLLPPPQVTLQAVTIDDTERPVFAWSGGETDDLAGFRLYRDNEAALPQVLLQGEGVIGPAARTYVHSAPLGTSTYFTVQAADTTEPVNLSTPSDVYGAAPQGSARRVLIVDGFDRQGGSWDRPWHVFAATLGEALDANSAGFETCANEAVLSGDVALADYDAVFWMLGDESTADETFSLQEQGHVAAYLEGGGRLFVSGSEVAWDLGNRGSLSDRAFLRRYLKVAYAGDDAEDDAVTGAGDGPFGGLSLTYGTRPYVEDYPDYYEAVEGGTPVLLYGNGRVAAVHYAGPFGAGEAESQGQVFVMGFPFETIPSATWRAQLVEAVLTAFFGTSSPAEATGALPEAVRLAPPYPNPFRTRVTIPFALPEPARVHLDVYDLLGRRVATLTDGRIAAGSHRLAWDTPTLAAGTYIVRLEVWDGGGASSVHTQHLVRMR